MIRCMKSGAKIRTEVSVWVSPVIALNAFDWTLSIERFRLNTFDWTLSIEHFWLNLNTFDQTQTLLIERFWLNPFDWSLWLNAFERTLSIDRLRFERFGLNAFDTYWMFAQLAISSTVGLSFDSNCAIKYNFENILTL